MVKGLVWTKMKSGEGTPSPRLGHSFIEMSKNVYIMYGGLDINSKHEGKIVPSGQVCTLKISGKGECLWTTNDTDGDEIPLPRSNHSAVKISENEMFVFGGYYSSKQRFNDVHILKIGNCKYYLPS